MISSETVAEIKELVNPYLLLESLGFLVSKKSPKELRAACLIHGGDNPTAFRFNLISKRFTCFTHGCELERGEPRNDVINLVMRCKNIGFSEAVRFLAQLCGMPLQPEDNDHIISFREGIYRDRVIKSSRIDSSNPPLPESLVKEYIKNRVKYFDLPDSVQDLFEVGTYKDSVGIVRASIPIRDHDGSLVSISGRRTDSDREPRYMLTTDFNKSRVLYNLHNALKYKDIFENTVIVVEGFKACWHLHMAGFPNTVGCMGAFLLPPQVQLLSNQGFLKCVLLLDGDLAGKKGEISSYDVASLYLKTGMCSLWDRFPGKSPDDVSPDKLIGLINSIVCSL